MSLTAIPPTKCLLCIFREANHQSSSDLVHSPTRLLSPQACVEQEQGRSSLSAFQAILGDSTEPSTQGRGSNPVPSPAWKQQ